MAKIMIVEDSAFMRIILKDIIKGAGHTIAAEAQNGAIAVDIYPDVRPDVVIMNIVMPEMYGIEALKRIKKLDPTAKVVMCSSMGNQHYVIESIQAGAMDFIVKPFDNSRLIEAINKASARK